MRVCSFLPSATKILYELGVEDQLYGVTSYCDSDKAQVVRSALDDVSLSSAEIDKVVSHSKRNKESLYTIDIDALRQLSPDVIFTQDVCEICQVDSHQVIKAIGQLDYTPTLVSLTPYSVEDIFETIKKVGKVMQIEDKAQEVLQRNKQRIEAIQTKISTVRRTRRSVFLMEWIDPIFNCGHWIPDQIHIAGGNDALSHPHRDSVAIEFNRLVEYDPETIIIAPCGYTQRHTIAQLQHPQWIKTSAWRQLRAMQNRQVYVIDGDLFTCPSLELVDGIEILAHILHSDLFGLSDSLCKRMTRLTDDSWICSISRYA